MNSVGLFNEWWTNHSLEFVSHATSHGSEILKEKTLRSAEEVFRLKGSVEHESSIGALRSISTQFRPCGNGNQFFIYNTCKDCEGHLPQFDSTMECEGCDVPYRNCFVIPDFTLDSGILKVLEQHFPEHRIEDNHESFVKFYVPGNHRVSPFPGGIYDMDVLADWPEENERPKRNKGTIEGMMTPEDSSPLFEQLVGKTKKTITYQADEAQGRLIDRTLRDIYDHCLTERFDKDRLAFQINTIRNKIFGNDTHRLSSDIRVEKNGVRWFYGPIAILVGNPRVRLAWEGTFSKATAVRQEFHLLNPFQVPLSESFHHITFNDPTVVVVGKREAIQSLEVDPNIDPAIKNRLIILEDLSDEQKSVLQ